MDDRLSGLIRLGLLAFGGGLVVFGGWLVAVAAAEVAGGVFAVLGVLVILVAAIGRVPSEFGATSAKWREKTVQAAVQHVRGEGHYEQATAGVSGTGRVAHAEPALGSAQAFEPTIRSQSHAGRIRPEGHLETKHLRRSASDDVSGGSDSIQHGVRTPEEYEQLAVWAKTPEQFGKLVAEAVEAERERVRREENAASHDEPEERSRTRQLIRDGLARAEDPHDPPVLGR